ncbi:MAG: GldG family protein [Proteobacteria bacterium]|nr:GldG family protein [Pseudomonadota bacterium]
MSQKHITRRQFILFAAILLGMLFAVLVAVNIIFSQVTTARWDLTSDGQFTLSPATSRLLGDLEDKVKIKVFLSKNLPAPDNTLYQNTRDLLAEFEAAAHGRLTFEIIEPETKTDEEIAKGFGLRRVAISQKDEQQRSMRMVFKGLTVIYRDAAETISELRSTDNLEYLIAKSIVNLTAPEKKTVGILTGFGGLAESPILRDSMAEVFSEVFGKRIQTEPIKVDEHCQLAPRPNALIMLNLETPLDDCARYAIEQASFAGTALAILQSPTRGDYRQPDQPRINIETNLNEVLKNTGVQLKQDLLLDRTHNLVGTQYTEDDAIPVSLPALPIITDLDKSHPITQNLTAIVLPFSGTIAIDNNTISAHHAQMTSLAASAPEAVSRPSGGDIAVDALQTPRSDETPGPHPLIVTLLTPQESQFNGKIPAAANASLYLSHADEVRYWIVPNGEFLFVNKIIGYTDNFAKFGIHLFVNATEWLVQDTALIEIRNRELPQMIQKPDKNTQKRIIWINVLGVPAIVILLMIGVRIWRKRRQKAIERKFKPQQD